MKIHVMLGTLLVLGWSATAEAQVAGGYSPVVLPAQYVSNYSPYTAAYRGGSPQIVPVQYYQPSQHAGGVGNGCGCSPQPQTMFLPPGGPPPSVVYRPAPPVELPPNPYHVGHGIIGQPKLYVTGQHVRNILRYLTP